MMKEVLMWTKIFNLTSIMKIQPRLVKEKITKLFLMDLLEILIIKKIKYFSVMEITQYQLRVLDIWIMQRIKHIVFQIRLMEQPQLLLL
jgi:hypothetical protein